MSDMGKAEHADLLEALAAIDPATLSYQEWVDCGMALHESGFAAADWDRWSRRDPARWHEGECERKWRSFGHATERVTSGTIVAMARERGWGDADVEIGWDDTITAVSADWADDVAMPSDDEPWDPARELSDYLAALFDDDDRVGIVTESWERDGRHLPTKGHWDRTAGELRQELASCGCDLGKVMGDWDEDAGAWVRFNPLDGRGCGNANVTEYRYALVESDTLDVGKQLGMIEAMRLPCAAVVSSGGKSVHAIVRIDAGTDYGLYRKRVERLYAFCKARGFAPDRQNGNPSRLSRMPGVTRGGRRQRLLRLSCGCATWDEWERWADSEEDDLPDERDCSDWDDPPRLQPLLIGDEEHGLLRRGQKMIVTGDSKMGKSYLLIDLAEAVATGGRWLGWETGCGRPGHVLYVNLEIEAEEFRDRLHRVWDDRHEGDLADLRRNLMTWPMRGHARELRELAPLLVRRVLRYGPSGTFALVIIDPVYKVNGGDDNDPTKVSAFTNAVDAIIEQCGCSVAYAHHHPKGTAGQKKSMDRMSGTGVYARDADVMVDLTAIEIPKSEMDKTEDIPAYRMSADCRSFSKPRDRDFLFRWPRFYETGELAKYKVEGEDPDAKRREGRKVAERRRREEKDRLIRDAFEACRAEGLTDGDGQVEVGHLMAHMGVREEDESVPPVKTVKGWADCDWCHIGRRLAAVTFPSGKSRDVTVFYDKSDPRENGWE
jgi:RecA-family ATPase